MSTLKNFKKIIFSILLTMLITKAFAQSDSSYTNKFAIGVKFNNPAGITVKKYYGKNAIELSLGRFSSYNYYRHFHKRYRHEYGNRQLTFTHCDRIDYPVALQLHYVMHKDITWFRGLTWYYGAGAQVRHAAFYYEYTYENGGLIVNERKKINYTGIGVDGVIGLEYTFTKVPLSMFYDAALYIEALQHPFYMKLQTGLGVRYNF